MSEKSSKGFTCAQPVLPPTTSSESSAEDGVSYWSGKSDLSGSQTAAYGLCCLPCKILQPSWQFVRLFYISSAFVAKDPLIQKGVAVALQKRYSFIPDKNNCSKTQFPLAFCAACIQLVLNSIPELYVVKKKKRAICKNCIHCFFN